jgi:acetylornithine deacetylase/succinyl-diaminopimelate desuccinylase-like protein
MRLNPAASTQTELSDIRERLVRRIAEQRERLMSFCSELGRIDSRNPPGDTTAMASACRRMLEARGVSIEIITKSQPMANLIAHLPGASPGRRLVFNGHLDTGPVPDAARWTFPPFGGVIHGDRIYGRGIADMKAGLAAQVLAVSTLTEFRQHLGGELVLMLVADEGTGGRNGTRHVLETRPELMGDAMISGDVGSPRVARVGEKGFIWIEVKAQGKSAAAAQPHLGVNAIDRLLPALAALRDLSAKGAAMPADLQALVEQASGLSEPINGAGETHTLKHLTVNVGMIEGGTRINNVPSAAVARVDIRMPPGETAAGVCARIQALLGGYPDVSWRVLEQADPNWTSPDAPIVRLLSRNAEAVLGQRIGVSIRPGFSDARFFRQHGVPTVVYGVTPHNSNAPDEHVMVADLDAVFQVHTLTAFDYLTGAPAE